MQAYLDIGLARLYPRKSHRVQRKHTGAASDRDHD